MRRFLILAIWCAGVLWGADRAADEAAVRAAVESYHQAAREGDRARLEKLFASGLVYGHSNAKIENKQEAVDALATSKPRFVWEPGWTVQLYGGTAVVAGKAMAHNAANVIPLHVLQVWVREGKAWKLVARHTTRLP